MQRKTVQPGMGAGWVLVLSTLPSRRFTSARRCILPSPALAHRGLLHRLSGFGLVSDGGIARPAD